MGIIEFDKSGREYGGVRINERMVSVEEATTRLRRRIQNGWLRMPMRIASLIWLLVRLLIKETLLFLFALVFLFGGAHNTWNFLIGFGLGSAYLLWSAYGETGGMVKRREKGGILIGDSFRHFTESQQSGKPVAVGSDGEHYIDYLGQPNPHVLMLGSTSSGKTTTMRTFVSRVSLANGINFLLLDWNGENEEFAKGINATVWKVPQHFKVNLFKLNGMTKEARAGMAVDSLVVAAHLTALQSTKVKSALLKFYLNGKEPSLFDLWNAICSKDTGKVNVLNQRLRAIQRVIGTEPDEFWKGIFAGNNVISLAGLNESEKSLVAYAIMQRLTELFDRNPEPAPKLKLLVVLDEAWQLFRREREFETLRESAVERIVRLGRKYGVGIVISTQQIEDVPKVFLNSSSLLMLHQHRELSYYGRDILSLNAFENAYVRSAAQGEMLLFDRGREQGGQWFSEYVKVCPLNGAEMRELAAKYKQYLPSRINEPEMPIEMHDSAGQQPAESTKDAANGLGMPSVVIYRFLVALSRSETLKAAHRVLKEKGWVTSDTTIYGNRSKPSLFGRAKASGYADEDGKLTDKGLDAVDSERLIARQGIYAGNEEHKELMRKTIRKIQDEGNFAFTTSDKDGFDVGEIGVKTKGAWDTKSLTIYECQTNAIKEEIEKGIQKARIRNAKLVWVAADNEVMESIRQQTSNGNEYLLVNFEEDKV